MDEIKDSYFYSSKKARICKISDLYYESMEERLKAAFVDKEISVIALSAVLADLHPFPRKDCDCGEPIVFYTFSRSFLCPRCGTMWKLSMEVTKVP